MNDTFATPLSFHSKISQICGHWGMTTSKIGVTNSI